MKLASKPMQCQCCRVNCVDYVTIQLTSAKGTEILNQKLCKRCAVIIIETLVQVMPNRSIA